MRKLLLLSLLVLIIASTAAAQGVGGSGGFGGKGGFGGGYVAPTVNSTFDAACATCAASAGTSGGSSSLSFTVVVSAGQSDYAGYAFLACNYSASVVVTAPTWGGTTMTAFAGNPYVDGANDSQIMLGYYLAGISSGTDTISFPSINIAGAGSGHCVAFGWDAYNVSQTTPANNIAGTGGGSGANPDGSTISSATGALVYSIEGITDKNGCPHGAGSSFSATYDGPTSQTEEGWGGETIVGAHVAGAASITSSWETVNSGSGCTPPTGVAASHLALTFNVPAF